jgi:hypothetical protein
VGKEPRLGDVGSWVGRAAANPPHPALVSPPPNFPSCIGPLHTKARLGTPSEGCHPSPTSLIVPCRHRYCAIHCGPYAFPASPFAAIFVFLCPTTCCSASRTAYRRDYVISGLGHERLDGPICSHAECAGSTLLCLQLGGLLGMPVTGRRSTWLLGSLFQAHEDNRIEHNDHFYCVPQ